MCRTQEATTELRLFGMKLGISWRGLIALLVDWVLAAPC